MGTSIICLGRQTLNNPTLAVWGISGAHTLSRPNELSPSFKLSYFQYVDLSYNKTLPWG